MMLSGLIMAEVEPITEHALASLDLHQNKTYHLIDNQYVPNETNNEQYIYCLRLYKDDGTIRATLRREFG
ncbi:unnamed protein product [Clonostachys rosea]|uniref:Uncharacterized protein n=1 Tax=Bionectria ochroleuca TaxID=29856 RepID=A0ABY6UEQ4_BIOOC|nr:unnamed protein product [Clonostachys rosea]